MGRSERHQIVSGSVRSDAGGISWQTVVMAALALALALGLLGVLWLLAQPLAVFFVAVVIAEALSPLVGWLERRMPRVAAVILVYAALSLLVALFAVVALPPLISQTEQAISHLPQLISRIGSLVNHIAPGAGTKLVQVISPNLSTIVSSAAAPPLTIVEAATVSVEIIFLSVYWLIAKPGMKRFALSLFPERRRAEVSSVLAEMGQMLGGYVRGTVIDALIVGLITYFGLLIIGVRYPLVLALVAVLGEFIPVIGPTIAEAIAVALALLSSPLKAVIVLAFYLVLQQFDGNVILPLVVRTQTNISPLLITFAVFIGGWVGGLIGALIAIPFAGLLKVLVVRIVAPAIRTWSGATIQSKAG